MIHDEHDDDDIYTVDVDARSMTPSRNTRSYTLRSVPSSPGRSFLLSISKCLESPLFVAIVILLFDDFNPSSSISKLKHLLELNIVLLVRDGTSKVFSNVTQRLPKS